MFLKCSRLSTYVCLVSGPQSVDSMVKNQKEKLKQIINENMC
jgi:hypothetical protein